jgi:hypothetical protein
LLLRPVLALAAVGVALAAAWPSTPEVRAASLRTVWVKVKNELKEDATVTVSGFNIPDLPTKRVSPGKTVQWDFRTTAGSCLISARSASGATAAAQPAFGRDNIAMRRIVYSRPGQPQISLKE